MSEIRPDVLIGLPSYDGKYPAYLLSTMNAMMLEAGKQGIRCALKEVQGSNIARERNIIASHALRLKANWLLFIDADSVVPRDGLTRLLAHKVNIVSGVYFGKQAPFGPIAYRKHGDLYGQITEMPENTLLDDIDTVGGGFLLINTSVFEHIKKPWFCFEENAEAGDVGGEDSYFCHKALRAGYKIHLDTGCLLGHVGEYVYTIDDWKNYFESNKGAGESGS